MDALDIMKSQASVCTCDRVYLSGTELQPTTSEPTFAIALYDTD